MYSKKILILSVLISFTLAGGIHRVAQSRWNAWSYGSATALNLYFALDNDLDGGYVYVTVPSGVTVTDCAVWPLGTDLDAPAGNDAGWIWGSYSSGVCDLTGTTLAADTAYGL